MYTTSKFCTCIQASHRLRRPVHFYTCYQVWEQYDVAPSAFSSTLPPRRGVSDVGSSWWVGTAPSVALSTTTALETASDVMPSLRMVSHVMVYTCTCILCMYAFYPCKFVKSPSKPYKLLLCTLHVHVHVHTYMYMYMLYMHIWHCSSMSVSKTLGSKKRVYYAHVLLVCIKPSFMHMHVLSTNYSVTVAITVGYTLYMYMYMYIFL